MSPANMKILLLSITLAVLLRDACGHIQAQKNFDLKRFGGRWYRVGLAYDAPSFAQYRSSLKVTMGKVDPKENGDANMTVWRTKSEGCKSKLYLYVKTAVPGVFNYYSTRHKIMKDVTVVETNYTEYALLFKYKKFNREYSQVALYGRAQKLRSDLIEKFKKYSLGHGFPAESIVTPPPAEACLPASQ